MIKEINAATQTLISQNVNPVFIRLLQITSGSTRDFTLSSLPSGSDFLKAFPASIKLTAAFSLLSTCRFSRADLQKALPAAEGNGH